MKGVIDLDIYKEKLIVSENMKKYGGSFIKALGEAILKADVINTAKIKEAFPEYWRFYLKC